MTSPEIRERITYLYKRNPSVGGRTSARTRVSVLITCRRLTSDELGDLDGIRDDVIHKIDYIKFKDVLQTVLPNEHYLQEVADGWCKAKGAGSEAKTYWVAWVDERGLIHTEDGVWIWEQGAASEETATDSITASVSMLWYTRVWRTRARPTLEDAQRFGVPESAWRASVSWRSPGPPGVPLASYLNTAIKDVGLTTAQLVDSRDLQPGKLRCVVHPDGVNYSLYRIDRVRYPDTRDSFTSDASSLGSGPEAIATLVTHEDVAEELAQLKHAHDAKAT